MSLSHKKGSNKEKLMGQHYESLFTKEQSDLLSSQPEFWDSFFLLPVRVDLMSSPVTWSNAFFSSRTARRCRATSKTP